MLDQCLIWVSRSLDFWVEGCIWIDFLFSDSSSCFWEFSRFAAFALVCPALPFACESCVAVLYWCYQSALQKLPTLCLVGLANHLLWSCLLPGGVLSSCTLHLAVCLDLRSWVHHRLLIELMVCQSSTLYHSSKSWICAIHRLNPTY